MEKALVENIMHTDHTDDGSDERPDSSSGTQGKISCRNIHCLTNRANKRAFVFLADEESPTHRPCKSAAECAVRATVHLSPSSREPGFVNIELGPEDIHHHSKRPSAAISALADSADCDFSNEAGFNVAANWKGELKTMVSLCWPLILTNTSTCIMVRNRPLL